MVLLMLMLNGQPSAKRFWLLSMIGVTKVINSHSRNSGKNVMLDHCSSVFFFCVFHYTTLDNGIKVELHSLLFSFCTYFTDVNLSYVNMRGKSEKSCGLYMKFSQMYHVQINHTKHM